MTELSCLLDELEKNWDDDKVIQVTDLKKMIERASEQHYVETRW